MRVCPRCGRTLSQTEKICPVCANAPSKKRRPYWIFVIAALLIVIVIMAVALYYLTLDRDDDKTETDVSIHVEEKDPEEYPEVVPEEPEDVPEADEPATETDDSEWIFPDSSERLLTEADIVGMDMYTLRLARNEILARHGYIFSSSDLRDYFNSCSWYEGTIAAENFDEDAMLNKIEKANLQFLLNAEKGEPQQELLAAGTYDAEGFYTTGVLRGYEDEDVIGVPCIDVSAYQGNIDWNAVANAGVEAAIIRVGYRGWGAAGTMVTDEYFRANIEGALNAGLDVGVYFFSQATTEAEAIEEAEYTMNLIRDYSITYPVIFNWEQMADGRTAAMTKDQITACAKAFCDAVERQGYRGGIYFDNEWVYNCYDIPALSSYILWFAHYTQHPNFPYDFSIWQYSNTGTIPGIAGNVDLNIIFTNQ